MKEKHIIHNKIERCRIGNSKIDTEKDNYCILVDCQGDNVTAIGFYRWELMNALVKGDLENIKTEILQNHMDKAKSMIQQLIGSVNYNG